VGGQSSEEKGGGGAGFTTVITVLPQQAVFSKSMIKPTCGTGGEK